MLFEKFKTLRNFDLPLDVYSFDNCVYFNYIGLNILERKISMNTVRLAVSLEKNVIEQIDLLVKDKHYPSRSQLIRSAVKEKISKLNKSRLATECEKLDSKFEVNLSEESFISEIEEWPEY
jgi:Arc/MetJ-type ribon-helix-helix transcriptional regulator